MAYFEEKEIDLAVRGQIKVDEVEPMRVALREKFKADRKTVNYFEELCIISDSMASHPGSIYRDSPILCMYAALVLAKAKKSVLLRLTPGRGKSWVCIMLAIHFKSK